MRRPPRGSVRSGIAARRLARVLLLAALVGPHAAPPALAQIGSADPLDRPGRRPLELEPFEDEAGDIPRLPPLRALPRAAEPDLGSGLHVRVDRLAIEGATVFTSDTLASLCDAYTGREIRSEELLQCRDRITRHYVQHGYVTSGAWVPDQPVDSGVVTIRVVEGTLAAVAVDGTRRLRSRWVERRLAPAPDEPVEIGALERRLQLLQRDPRIARVEAELVPGERRGESLLDVVVEEASPLRASLHAGNDHSPSIGGPGGALRVEHLNVLGFGDSVAASYERTAGLEVWDARWAVPLTARDTRLELFARSNRAEVVYGDFDALDIESRTYSGGITLSHPLHRTPLRELRVGVTAEYRKSELGIESFDDFRLREQDGEGLEVLRLFQSWTSRSRDRVLSLRSSLNVGLGFGSRRPGEYDGRFTSWLAQLQWARHLGERFGGSQIVVRADLQLADDQLPSIEQFAVGGLHSVRGYRENALVRDSGLAASIELRIPLLRSALGEDQLLLLPFLDLGKAWDADPARRSRTLPSAGVEPRSRTLPSAGVGLWLRPNDRVSARIYWGRRLRNFDPPGGTAQDRGLHFEISLRGL